MEMVEKCKGVRRKKNGRGDFVICFDCLFYLNINHKDYKSMKYKVLLILGVLFGGHCYNLYRQSELKIR